MPSVSQRGVLCSHHNHVQLFKASKHIKVMTITVILLNGNNDLMILKLDIDTTSDSAYDIETSELRCIKTLPPSPLLLNVQSMENIESI